MLAGAAAAVTTRLGIATAATNHNTRHPLVTATMATTLHRLSGGRYALGLGRGFDLLFDVMGLPRVTGAQMEDAIGIYRTALARRGVRPRRARRQLPVPLPGQELRRGHPGADDGHRPEEPRAGRPGRRRRRAAHLLHRRDAGPRRTHHPRERRARPARTRRRSGSGRCWPPSRSPSPRSSGCASWSAGWPPTCRGTARCWSARTAGTRRPSSGSAPTTLVQGYPGAFDAIGTVEELSHLRDDVLPDASGWPPSATGSAAECAGADPGPARRRRGQRGAARRDPDRARAGPSPPGARCDRTGSTPAPRQPRTDALGQRQEEPLQLVELLLAHRAPCGPTRAARPR